MTKEQLLKTEEGTPLFLLGHDGVLSGSLLEVRDLGNDEFAAYFMKPDGGVIVVTERSLDKLGLSAEDVEPKPPAPPEMPEAGALARLVKKWDDSRPTVNYQCEHESRISTNPLAQRYVLTLRLSNPTIETLKEALAVQWSHDEKLDIIATFD